VRRLALRYNFIAKPKKDRWNRRIIPICGGAAIYISFMISYFVYNRTSSLFLLLAGGATAAFLCGFVDDIFSIKPYSKLFVQIIISSFMCLGGIRVDILPVAFLNIFLTIFWFVAIMNAFNLLDNMDGLCAGITVISAGLIFAYHGFDGDHNVAMLALLVGAAALGFLRYNFHPAKIFMGDCGSMFIGFVLAATTVIGTWKGASNFLVTLAVPVLVLGVPVFDTILVTLTRQLNGRHFYEGGKDHASHRLVVLGMSEMRAVLTLYFISLGCGLAAFMYTKLNVAVMIILMTLLLLLLIFFGIFLSQVKIYTTDGSPKKTNGNNKIFLSGMIYHKQKMFEMMIDLLVISTSFIGAYLLRYEGVLSPANVELIVAALPVLIIIKLSSFYWFGLYKGVWQYIGLHDLFDIFKAVTFGCMTSMVALAFMFNLRGYSRAVFIIDWLILLIAVSLVRFAMRLFREYFYFASGTARKVFIMGAGDAGEYLLRGIKYNKKLNYAVAGFLDDNPDKYGRKIHGVEIIGTSADIPALAKKYNVSEVLVAIPSLQEAAFEAILQTCERNGIACRRMSELELW
jgi:UDP-GlcNAc:undecaprenyl-phosphate GlcNAc-1-phosphate transferase